MTTFSQRATKMDEDHKDLAAGAVLMLLFAATLLCGWLVLLFIAY